MKWITIVIYCIAEWEIQIKYQDTKNSQENEAAYFSC